MAASGSAHATAGGGGWGNRFRVGAAGAGPKLGEPHVLDAVIPTGTIGKTEQSLTSRVAPEKLGPGSMPGPDFGSETR